MAHGTYDFGHGQVMMENVASQANSMGFVENPMSRLELAKAFLSKGCFCEQQKVGDEPVSDQCRK